MDPTGDEGLAGRDGRLARECILPISAYLTYTSKVSAAVERTSSVRTAVVGALVGAFGSWVPRSRLLECLRPDSTPGTNDSAKLTRILSIFGENLKSMTFGGTRFSLEFAGSKGGSVRLTAAGTAAPGRKLARLRAKLAGEWREVPQLDQENLIAWAAPGGMSVLGEVGPSDFADALEGDPKDFDREIFDFIAADAIPLESYDSLLLGVQPLGRRGMTGELRLELRPMLYSWALWLLAHPERSPRFVKDGRANASALRPLKVALLVEVREGFVVTQPLRSRSDLSTPTEWIATCRTGVEIMCADDLSSFSLPRCAAMMLYMETGVRCRADEIAFVGCVEIAMRAPRDFPAPRWTTPCVVGIVRPKNLNLSRRGRDGLLDFRTLEYIFQNRRDRKHAAHAGKRLTLWGRDEAAKMAHDRDARLDNSLRLALTMLSCDGSDLSLAPV